MNVKIISAGAGSGKTYRLTTEMTNLLKNKEVRASGIIATTFTNKAAAELQERVRVRLLEEGLSEAADDLTNALIGTVHGLGVKLLRRFAFEAGVSPEVSIMAEEDRQVMFNLSLSVVLTQERVEAIEAVCQRLGKRKRNDDYDWRSLVREITEKARNNGFQKEVLELSKQNSFESFSEYLPDCSDFTLRDWNMKFQDALETSIHALETGEDATKVTLTALKTLKETLRELQLKGTLDWWNYVKVAKLKTGAKSRDAVAELKEIAKEHECLSDFQEDIRTHIYQIFDVAIDALAEYDRYKKQRGLIDYTDMEVLVKELLQNENVRSVLQDELDLLMVDEFQDTSPMQLEIFLQLSRLAKQSIWVGDPKQSIYGFRGAEPKLMKAIIHEMGGVKDENILKNSWRSREEIVHLSNALFCKAFDDLDPSQVALDPVRKRRGSQFFDAEPAEMKTAVLHWHCVPDVEGNRMPGRPWMENSLARCIRRMLDRERTVFDKSIGEYRTLQPGDIAVICRSNSECQTLAESLYRVGINSAISRAGLLHTAEIKLVLACLKFIIDRRDALAIAEILVLTNQETIESILQSKLKWEARNQSGESQERWGLDYPFIARLNQIRQTTSELSSTEILNLLLEEADLRRYIITWGSANRRLENIDQLRSLAMAYEETCNRLHSAASLPGLLLYLNDLASKDMDKQSGGQSANAVNLVTYHASKGLEYPVAICYSLENKLRGDVWNLSLVNEAESVDLDNVLSNRWLRFWVNPYADQSKGTPLVERISNGPEQKEVLEAALKEEARLLYVGITRARDYLVFPTRKNPTLWLNRVYHNGDEKTPVLDIGSTETIFEWNGEIIEKANEEEYFPVNFPASEPPIEPFEYPVADKITDNGGHDLFFINPKKEARTAEMKMSISSELTIGTALKVGEGTDNKQIGKLLDTLLNGYKTSYAEEVKTEMLQLALQRFGLEDYVEIEDIKGYLEKVESYFTQQFSGKKYHRQFPVRAMHSGRLFRSLIDRVIESEKEITLIQYHPFAGKDDQIGRRAKELETWFYYCRKSLLPVFENKEIKTWIYFTIKNKMVALSPSRVVSSSEKGQMSLF